MALHHRTVARYGYAPLLVFACTALTAAPPDSQSRLSPELTALYQAALAGTEAATPAGPSAEHFDAQGRVLVEVDLACAGALPAAALKGAGLALSASVNVPPLCAVEGWVAPKSLAALSQVTGVVRVKLPASAAARTQPVRHAAAQL